MSMNDRFVLVDRDGYPMAVCTADHVQKELDNGRYIKTDNPRVVTVR